MDSNPDSALVLIERIKVDGLKSEEEQARYALLYSIALDKNYIDLQSDSIIRPAVKYYSIKRSSAYRMKTWYYKGRIQLNCGDYSAAIVTFEKAERDALYLEDFYYLGLIYREKSSIYNNWNNSTAAIYYSKQAYSAFKRAGKDVHAAYSLLSIGISLFNGKEYDEAIEYINKAKKEYDATSFLNNCNLRLADLSVEKEQNPDSLIGVFNSIPLNLFHLYDYGYLALACERANMPDSANAWINRGYLLAKDEADSASLDYMVAGIISARGNYREAYSLIKHATDVQDTYTQSILKESLNSALKNYYQGELTLEEERAARERDKKIWMGILGCLVTIALSLFFIYRLKRKKQLLKQQIALYAAVKNENQEIRQENTRLIGSLFSSRLHNLDVLSKEYFTADEKNKKEIVFNAFNLFLEEFRNDDDAFAALEHDLDLYADGIMRKLGEQVPRIDKEKRKIIALFFAGLPYETIQLITKSVSIDSLRMQRSRFRKQIKDANAPDAELFLSMLDINNVAESNKTKA